MTTDQRQHSTSSERNRAPIQSILERYLPMQGDGLVFEVASGTGQHTAFFAGAFSNLTFQPSDLSEDAHDSISAWVAHEGLTNVRPPMRVDASEINPVDLVFDSPVVAVLNMPSSHFYSYSAVRIIRRRLSTPARPACAPPPPVCGNIILSLLWQNSAQSTVAKRYLVTDFNSKSASKL